jgi:hypothetical protein
VKRIVIVVALSWVLVITVLHLWLNLDIRCLRASRPSDAEGRFRIGFLPVT